jgi:hypothetical protein
MFRFIGKVFSSLLSTLFAMAILIGGCLGLVGMAVNGPKPDFSNLNKVTKPAQQAFSKSVADDLVTQYEIVKKGDDEMAKSVRAGAVAEMFLHANDETSYQKWKSVADSHMKKAIGN